MEKVVETASVLSSQRNVRVTFGSAPKGMGFSVSRESSSPFSETWGFLRLRSASDSEKSPNWANREQAFKPDAVS